MERHFHHELDTLKSNIVRMATLVEESIAEALRALMERSPEIARRVLEREQQINSFELSNDQAIVDLLALQQPVASDLRLILAALKINNDLERIGDHAVNLAESAISHAAQTPLDLKTELPRMTQLALQMLREAIDGFIHSTPAGARGVLQKDDLMDSLNRKTINDLVNVIRSRPEAVDQALELVRVSRNLERVADLATNIAEEVVFMSEAQVVKHRTEKEGRQA
jgi:phosphate transport system protein